MIEYIKLHIIAFIFLFLILLGGLLLFIFWGTFFNVIFPDPVFNSLTPQEQQAIRRAFKGSISKIKINSVSSDEINFYVSYSYRTTTVVENVEQTEKVNDTLTASKELVAEDTLGDYVAQELSNKFENVDQIDIKQQVEEVLATPNWEAPPDPNDSTSGSGNTGNQTPPDTLHPSGNPEVVPGANGNPGDTTGTYVPPVPVPPVYYPPYDGPPIPDVDNTVLNIPIPN